MSTNISMGIPDALRDNANNLVRAFRFVVEGDLFPTPFVSSVHVDYAGHTLDLEVYEVVEEPGVCSIDRWVDSIPTPGEEHFFSPQNDKSLTLKWVNGCGQQQYARTFHGLFVIDNNVKFSYDDKSIATRKLTVQYREVTTGRPEEPQKAKPRWVMIIGDKTFEVELQARPTLHIEEVVIPHLHSRMTIPGKATWDPLDVKVGPDLRFHVDLIWKEGIVTFKYLDHDGTPLETWAISQITHIPDTEDGFHLSFNNAQFKPNKASETPTPVA